MEQESESTPRDTTRRTTVFHSIKISGLSEKATIRWLRTSCRWHTPVRAAVFCRTPSEAASGRSKLRPSRCERNKARPDAATGPAAGCPPVCQRTLFLPKHDTIRREHENDSRIRRLTQAAAAAINRERWARPISKQLLASMGPWTTQP